MPYMPIDFENYNEELDLMNENEITEKSIEETENIKITVNEFEINVDNNENFGEDKLELPNENTEEKEHVEEKEDIIIIDDSIKQTEEPKKKKRTYNKKKK
jgi:hypothetical protein